MGRISKAAAGAAASVALLGGIAGTVLTAVPVGAAGAVRVCHPTAVEYGATAPGCATPHVTAIEY